HEGLKGCIIDNKKTYHLGYSCCKKRVTSFEEFLTLPGCTSGSHSIEQVSRPAPVNTAASTDSPTVLGPTSVEGATETYGQKMITTPVPTPVVVEEKKPEPLEQDDLSIPVEKGTKCKRNGCNAEFVSEEISRGDGPKHNVYFIQGISIQG